MAEATYKEAFVVMEAAFGPNHPDVAVTLESWAGVLRLLGRLDEAEALEARAQAIRKGRGDNGE